MLSVMKKIFSWQNKIKENGKFEAEAKSLRQTQKSPEAKADARGYEAKAEAIYVLT